MSKSKPIPITKREKDCLLLLAQGKKTSEIAQELKISNSGVTFHIQNAVRKLKTLNRTNAVAKAILLKLIKPKL